MAVGAHGAQATGYEVRRFSTASGGAGEVVCATGAATSCVDTVAQTSTVYYGLRARFAENWVEDSPRVQHVPDVAGPADVTIVGPRQGFRPGGLLPPYMSSHLADVCKVTDPPVFACGTMVAEPGLTLAYRAFRSRWPEGDQCWNPVAARWEGARGASDASGCPAGSAVAGGPGWIVVGPSQDIWELASWLNPFSYDLRVTVADRFRNQTEATSRFQS